MIKNQKGFAMVLSLVLLLAMSLMGGALILIASGDHQGNNDSDQYQQTFYAAEMGLLDGEQYILNEKNGPWDASTNARNLAKSNLPEKNTTKFTGVMYAKNYSKKGKFDYRITSTKKRSKKFLDTSDTCFKSFKDIDKDDFYVIKDDKNLNVARSMNVGVLLENSFASGGTAQEKLEATRMKKFYYEYFIERIGAANVQLVGSSIKTTATDASKNGLAYRVYSCGIYGEDGDKNKMIVSLESVVVIPKN
jgi:hypothetical protein